MSLNLKEELDQFYNNINEELKEEDVFIKLISSKPTDLQIVQQSTHQNKSVCGAQVPNGELTFQCFTCAPDPHHMFCYKCFEIEKHINHKCIIKHNIGGCCDCGDEQTIAHSGFCSIHKGFGQIAQYDELNKIPQDLQINIEKFMKQIIQLYLEQIDIVQSQYKQYDPLIVKYYKYVNETPIQQFKDVFIQENIEIDQYYNSFRKALFLHTVLFSQIQWMTQSNLSFILLISKILRTKLNENSQNTIMEEILQRQIVLETQGPVNSYKLEKIIFSFHADQEFKEYMQTIYIKNYKYLWLIVEQKDIPQSDSLEKQLPLINQVFNQKQLQHHNEPLNKIAQYLLLYIQQWKQKKSFSLNICLSEIHEQHTQYVSEKFQTLFLQNEQLKEIFQTNHRIQQTLHQGKTVISLNSIFLIGIFKLRFEYSFFYKIIFKQLQDIFKENYNNLFTQIITKNQLINFNINEFIFSQIIQSFEDCQPCEIDANNEMIVGKETILDSAYYLIGQGFALKTLSIGLQQTFFNNKVTDIFKENIIQILMFQCYQILKQKRNQFISDQSLLNNQFEKYLPDNGINMTDPEKFEISCKIYLAVSKSGNQNDRFLTLLLCQIYCQHQFDTINFRKYLCNLFDQDFYELKYQFFRILQRSILSWVAISFSQNQLLSDVYLGLRDQKDQDIIESYDLAFIRIYIYLFGIEGFEDFQQIFAEIHLKPQKQLSIQNFILTRLVTSELDIYNCCSSFYQAPQKLPINLKLSLAKLLCVFYNLETYLEFSDIQKKLIQLGITVTNNLKDHILEICELDQAVKKLKLKPQYQKLYDPAIFHIQTDISAKIVDKLIEQNNEQKHIFLGNGIDWEINQFNIEKRQSLFYFLKYYSSNEFILKNLENLSPNQQFSIHIYYLIYVQIKAAHYFKLEELQKQSQNYLDTLKNILQNTTRKDDQERLNVLIQQIHQITSIQLEKEQINIHQSEIQKNIKKDKLKAKYTALQNNENLQKLLNEQNKNQPIITEECLCQSCKQPIFYQESNCIILLVRKSQQINFKLIDDIVYPQINNEKFNLDQIGITGCKHYYHQDCLIQQFEIHQKNVNQELPIWVQLGCPVCKQACNFQIPLSENISNKQMLEYIQSLLSFSFQAEMNSYQQLKYQNNDVSFIIDLQYQLILDLLIQILSNPQEYRRNQKYNIFKQLIKLLIQYMKQIDITQNQENLKIYFTFNDQDSFILKIMNSITSLIFGYYDYDVFISVINNLIENYYNENQLISELLLQSFNIKQNNKEIIQIETQKQQKVESFYEKLNYSIQDTIINQLGITYQQFYFKYFQMKCSICQFYDIKQSVKSDQFMCLLCSKVFCSCHCTKTQYGNLNMHSEECHKGNSIFVSLSTGTVTLVSFPISISNYQCLYYNSLGQKIQYEDSKCNWENFVLEKEKVRILSEIILNNSYQSIVRNLEVRKNQLDLYGNL